ncbi:hypothetical protein LWQ05_005126, partial [Salmonella enterica]|nr:hypothetical protein [Salmonella enterica]
MKKTACDHYVYTDEEAAKLYRRVLYFVKDFGPFALTLIALGATFGIVFWIEPGIAVFGALVFFGLAVSASPDAGAGQAFFYPDRRSLTPLKLNDWKVLNARAEHHPDVLALLVAATKHGRTLRGRDFDALYGIVERRREHKRKVLNAEKEAADRLAEQQAEAAAVAEIQ